MFFHIPIGEKLTVVAEKVFWKLVCCSQCHEKYAYRVKLKAVGTDHNFLFLDSKGCEQRAQAQAEENLSAMRHNVDLPVPCPNCGFYQNDMVQRVKDEGMGSRVAMAGLAITALSFVPLAFGIPNIWILTAAGVVIGLSMIAYVDIAAAQYNPNDGDPELRKARGQQQALWGQELNDLLATIPNAE